jgi:hypothetical protein
MFGVTGTTENYGDVRFTDFSETEFRKLSSTKLQQTMFRTMSSMFKTKRYKSRVYTGAQNQTKFFET